jgi:putative tryptophan/tyrosine transport system substrate-binding protein
LGISVKTIEYVAINDAIEGVKSVTTENTAIILGSQSLLFDNANVIVPAAGKTSVFTYNTKAVDKGALAGFVADDVFLGKLLAHSVADVLKNGKCIADVPVKLDPDPKLKINKSTMMNLGLLIPMNILKRAELVQ